MWIGIEANYEPGYEQCVRVKESILSQLINQMSMNLVENPHILQRNAPNHFGASIRKKPPLPACEIMKSNGQITTKFTGK